ncbi:hypothetical protein [Geochorda subterranea]|uniref:Uncharacterized protein n=1 Tax=Geochorda subterranea TaxID=3109564 RepID=A0ABZ1BNL4_9FIRM|nr:hypothetical protein [Limnochorda sp. LNt]WRP13717.1 hypothetical protein VLY81_09725 [Limnochorda sp. LNt]
MVFEDRTPRISPTSFCATVGAMFTRAIEGRGAGLVTIHPLGREEELLGFLRSSKRVITAQFSVVPPNGLEGEHTWERLVAKFQELNATSHFVQWRSSDPDGLNWEHTEIEDYARYTTKGYGVASIQAETQDGHIVRYKSSDGGIRLTLECPDLDVFQEVMRVLSKALAIKEDPSSPGGA